MPNASECVAIALTSIVAPVVCGCNQGTSSTRPATIIPAAIHCDVCGKPLDPRDARSRITPDGLDSYTCKVCVNKQRPRRPLRRG